MRFADAPDKPYQANCAEVTQDAKAGFSMHMCTDKCLIGDVTDHHLYKSGGAQPDQHCEEVADEGAELQQERRLAGQRCSGCKTLQEVVVKSAEHVGADMPA